MTNINYDFIESLEGFETRGYVPDPKGSNSGVTIGSGVDLGARNIDDLNKLNLPEELVNKLEPYLGKQKTDAKKYLNKNPLNLSDEEARLVSRAVQSDMANSLARKWKEKTGQDFSELSENKATVVASVAFQYGDLASKTPNFWEQVTSNNWEAALANLRDFEDKYPTRRNKEADFLSPTLPIRRPIESRQEGGPVEAGKPYLVGEAGPEIIIPEQSGTVIPNNQLPSPFNAAFDFAAFADQYAQLFPAEPETAPVVEKPKMKYIKFDDPKVPRFAVPENLSKEDMQNYMKSPFVEQEMFNKGYLYKYGLDPVRYDDPTDLDDWNFTAGAKSGFDNLKAIGSGVLYTMADLFDNEDAKEKFSKMVEQYNLDSGVHMFKEGEEGQVDLRITTIEDMLQDENKLGAFLDWASFNMGVGAATMLPLIGAGVVGGGVGVAIGAPTLFTIGTSQIGLGGLSFLLGSYAMGVGEATNAQLERSGDSNAAISIAAAIPYAASEFAFGASSQIVSAFAKRGGLTGVKSQMKDLVKTKFNKVVTDPSIIKEVSKGVAKGFAGEATAEGLQEIITSSAAEIGAGASLQDLYSTPDFWKQVGEAAAAGGVAGFGIGAVPGAINYAKQSRSKVEGAFGIGKMNPTETETIKKTGATVGDTVTIEGAYQADNPEFETDGNPPEFTILGETVNLDGSKNIVLRNNTTNTIQLLNEKDASKVIKVEENQVDKQDKDVEPEYLEPENIPSEARLKRIVKELKRRGYNSTEVIRNALEADKLKSKEDWKRRRKEIVEEQQNEYRLEAIAGIGYSKPAFVKPYDDAMNKGAIESGETTMDALLEKDWINWSNITLDRAVNNGDPNVITPKQQEQLTKLGYYNGKNGRDLIETHRRDFTPVKDNPNINRGRQRIQEIIDQGIPYEPMTVSTRTLVESRRVPPLNQRNDQEFENLTQQQKLADFETAKVDEEIQSLRLQKRNLDTKDPTYKQNIRDINIQINDLQTQKEARVLQASSALGRIDAIVDILNRLDIQGIRFNPKQMLRAALKIAKKQKNQIEINAIQGALDKAKSEYTPLVRFGTGTVFVYSDIMVDTARKEIKFLESQRKGGAEGLSAAEVEALTDEQKAIYIDQTEKIQEFQDIIEVSLAKRKELNTLLESFNIEPLLNFKDNKPRIPGAQTIEKVKKQIRQLRKELYGYDENVYEKNVDTYWSVSNYPNSLDRPKLSLEAIKSMAVISDQFQKELNQLGLDNLSIRLIDSIMTEEGTVLNGRYFGGLGLIEVAMNATTPVDNIALADSQRYTMHHESMHYIFNNLLTPKEQNVLRDAARKTLINRYNIKNRYGPFGLNQSQMEEEAISDYFAEYMATTPNGALDSPKGIIGRVFERIRTYLITLANILRNNGLNGANQVFDKLDYGTVIARRAIMSKTVMQTTEISNIAKAAGISVDEAQAFIQRGLKKTKVLNSGYNTGSITDNIGLYNSFILYQQPRTGLMTDPSLRKITTLVNGLMKSLTTKVGLPNISEANYYLAELKKVTSQELNAAIASLQSADLDFAGKFETFSAMELGTATRAQRQVMNLLASLNSRTQGVEIFTNRLNRITLPTESDLRIAGSIKKTYHFTSQGSTIPVLETSKISELGLHFASSEMQAKDRYNMKVRGGETTLTPVVGRRTKTGGVLFQDGRFDIDEATEEDLGSINTAILYINNPLRMPDMGNWDTFKVLERLTETPTSKNFRAFRTFYKTIDVSPVLFTEKENAAISRALGEIEANFMEGKSQFKNYKNMQSAYLVKKIKEKGYDGIVYVNMAEGMRAGDFDRGVEKGAQESFIVFDSNQIQEVEFNSNPDFTDINYQASVQMQESVADDELSKPETMNRQQQKKGVDDLKKTAEATDKIFEDGKEASLKDISFFGKWANHARNFATKYPVVARLWDSISRMEQKGREIQTQFVMDMRRYFDVINNVEGAKVALAKAHIISQQEGAQGRYRRDANGQIIFVSPIDMTTGGTGQNVITVNKGEIIILEGDIAIAYEEAQLAIQKLLEEIKKGMIASNYVDDIINAAQMINIMDPNLLQQVGLDVNTLNRDTVENINFQQLSAIVVGLQTMEQRQIDSAQLELFAPLPVIQQLLGTEEAGLKALQKQIGIYEEYKTFDYVPLQRYGEFFITVKDSEGKVVHAESIEKPYVEERATGQTFEKKKDEVISKLAGLYPASAGFVISDVKASKDTEREKVIQEFSALDVLASKLPEPNAKAYAEVRAILDKRIEGGTLVGFDQFLRGRKKIGGVPGFDGDILRGITSFGMVASEYAGRNRFLKEVRDRTSTAIKYTEQPGNQRPKLKEAIQSMVSYGVDNSHHHEFALPRRLGFWWFLGGNLSSGILQIMSAVQFTGPILAQFSNSGAVLKEMTRAAADVSKMITFTNNEFNDVYLDFDKIPADVREAVKEDVANGIIKQGQAIYEAGMAPGYAMTPTEKTKLRSKVRQFEQSVMGGVFNTFETISRLTAYIAAYRISNNNTVMERANEYYGSANELWNVFKERRGGVATQQDFARILIDDTFGNYSKTNRPRIMRGPGSVFFLFQTYISQMFFLLHRLMTQGGPQGRKMFARVMVMLFITGGLMGMPGMEELDQIYKMIQRMRGVNEDMRTVMREMFTETVGPQATEFLMQGAIEAGTGASVQRRLSLGEVPGSAQIRALMGMMGFPTGARAEEFLGAPGAVFIDSAREMKDIFSREGTAAFYNDLDLYMAAMPTFIKNLYRATYKYPTEGYVETKYGTIVTADLTALDLIKQGIGFTPTKISKERTALYYDKAIEGKYSGKIRGFNTKLKRAYRDIYIGLNVNPDPGMVRDAQLEINKIMREIMAFNNKVGYEYMYFPQLSRLQSEGIQQANTTYRNLKTDKSTKRLKDKMRESLNIKDSN